MSFPEALRDKAAAIRLLVCDIDGVLTDGTLSYTPDGEMVKHFNVKDGLGINLLKSQGITVALISGRKSDAILRRAQELQIEHVHLGVRDKVKVLQQLADELGVQASEVAYVGDDMNDVPAMTAAALAFAVQDSHFLVKETADWVTETGGGRGAVREIADILLSARGNLKKMYGHLLGIAEDLKGELQ